jgi:hypothetical protein
MKKVINFWSLAMVVAMCVSVSSCSRDNDENSNGNSGGSEFIELTINEKTYTNNPIIMGGAGFGSCKGRQLFAEDAGGEYYCLIELNYSRYNSDFQNSTPGTYRIISFEFDYSRLEHKYKATNLDLLVDFSIYGTGKTFELISGVHNVTEIKFINTDSNSKSKYSVSGNFSCEHRNSQTGKTYTTTGRYKTTVEVN